MVTPSYEGKMSETIKVKTSGLYVNNEFPFRINYVLSYVRDFIGYLYAFHFYLRLAIHSQ